MPKPENLLQSGRIIFVKTKKTMKIKQNKNIKMQNHSKLEEKQTLRSQ